METQRGGTGLGLHPGQAVRLNLGAGNKRIEGWASVDLAGEPDIRADVREIPVPDGYADEAMAIHVLEHLYRWDAPAALKEWHRILKPGGLMAIEVPDLIKSCQNVLARRGDRMGVWGLFGDPGYCDPLMVHRWAWTAEELTAELKAAGFRRIKVCTPHFHKKARDMRIEAHA